MGQIRPLLWRLLDQYERRKIRAQGAPLVRDVLLKLDHKTFPEAWAFDGAEVREGLFAAVRELEAASAVRVIYGRGLLRGIPQEVRLGEGEVEAAFNLAENLGYVPFHKLAEELSGQILALVDPALPSWMSDYLKALAHGIRQSNLELVGMGVERFKRDPQALFDALKLAVDFSVNGGGLSRIISERATGDSKRLDSLRGLVSDILVRADPKWKTAPPGSAAEILADYGLRGNPVFLYCAGGIVFKTPSGGQRNLIDDEPSAALSEGLVPALAEAFEGAGELVVTIIENETPYHQYIEERGGPGGLADRGEFVLYSGGFPSSVVRTFLEMVARKNPNVRFRHWGDPDVGGFQIWWTIRNAVGREVPLYRTTPKWLAAAAAREARPLTEQDRSGLRRIRESLERSPLAAASDVEGVIEMSDEVLSFGKWIEQERFLS